MPFVKQHFFHAIFSQQFVKMMVIACYACNNMPHFKEGLIVTDVGQY